MASQFVTQSVYIQHNEKLLAETRKQILDGFQTLDSIKMDALEQSVHYRKKLIAFAKSGKQKVFLIHE